MTSQKSSKTRSEDQLKRHLHPAAVELISMTGSPKSNFNNSFWWTPINISDTNFATTATAPDGTTAQKVIANTTSGTHGVRNADGHNAFAGYAGYGVRLRGGPVTYRMSVDVKAAEYTRVVLLFGDMNANGIKAGYNLSGGTVFEAVTAFGSGF